MTRNPIQKAVMVAALATASVAISPAYANDPGFNQGKQFASQEGGVSVKGSAMDDVPDGGGNASEQRGLFQDGSGDAVGPGMTKIGTCASKDDPECSAINYMNQNPAPDYPISETDPLVTGADEIKAKAEEIAGPNVTSEAACIEQEVTTPDQVTQERCETFRHGNRNVCDVERVIQVDQNVLYECKDGYTMDTKTCSKKRVVDVKVTEGKTVHVGTKTSEPPWYDSYCMVNSMCSDSCAGNYVFPSCPSGEDCYTKTSSACVNSGGEDSSCHCYGSTYYDTDPTYTIRNEYWSDACQSADAISVN